MKIYEFALTLGVEKSAAAPLDMEQVSPEMARRIRQLKYQASEGYGPFTMERDPLPNDVFRAINVPYERLKKTMSSQQRERFQQALAMNDPFRDIQRRISAYRGGRHSLFGRDIKEQAIAALTLGGVIPAIGRMPRWAAVPLGAMGGYGLGGISGSVIGAGAGSIIPSMARGMAKRSPLDLVRGVGLTTLVGDVLPSVVSAAYDPTAKGLGGYARSVGRNILAQGDEMLRAGRESAKQRTSLITLPETFFRSLMNPVSGIMAGVRSIPYYMRAGTADDPRLQHIKDSLTALAESKGKRSLD